MNGEVNGPRSSSSKKASKRRLQVALLDDTVVAFDVEPHLKADVLFKKVNSHLNLEEAEYFGLQFVDADANMCWLDPLKSVNRQLKDATKQTFKFRVMFYTPDPSGLQEYTRYLFTLQVRRDLLDGRLHCSPETGALLASYIVQGELGDHDPANHKDGYLSGFQFVPSQTAEVEQKIVDYHKSHRGLSPAEADRSMLEIARQLQMYGVIRYPVVDHDGAALSIAVHHMGLLVFQGDRRINSFSWANIRKLSFKRKKFLLKLHPGIRENGDLVFFTMRSRDACKNFWKVVVSHHVFFRHKSAETLKRRGSSLKRGSKFRYSGRTRKEILDEASGKVAPLDSEKSRSTTLANSRLEAGVDTQSMVASSRSSLSHPGKERAYEVATGSATPASLSSMSTDEGSYLVKLPQEDSELVGDELAEDHIIADSSFSEAKVVTLSYQDTDDSNEENVIDEIVDSYSASSVLNGHKSSLVDEEIMQPCSSNITETAPDMNFAAGVETECELEASNLVADADAFDLDASITVTSADSELVDEVNSMFQKINSEYSLSGSAWQYQMTSVKMEEVSSDGEADREKVYHDSLVNGHASREGAALDSPLLSKNDEEDEPQGVAVVLEESPGSLDLAKVDVEAEMQLEEKIRALYMKPYHVATYDSDSDASALGVDEEESAFEDDISLPRSKSGSMNNVSTRGDYMQEIRKLRMTGKPYCIAREILLTERTYLKDLEVLTVAFRSVVEKDDILPEHLLQLLYNNIDPLYDFHCSLLAELEERLTLWENVSAAGDNIHRIGDIMHRNMRQMKLYTSYIQKHGEIVLELESELSRSKAFETAYKEFELGKACYLSLNSFLLKPVQRLLYYKTMLGRLVKEYTKDDPDLFDAKVAYEEVFDAWKQVEESMRSLENLHKLVELGRDLIGIENLVHPRRMFLREGCLHKICRKGPQPRMFFLLSDILLYTSQGVTASNQFRARSFVPLKVAKVEEGGVDLHGLYAFTVAGFDGRSFVVAASSPEERSKWTEDLVAAITTAVQESICPKCQGDKTAFMLYVGQDMNALCANCKEEVRALERMAPHERLTFWQQKYPPSPTITKPLSGCDSDDEGGYVVDNVSSLDRRHARAKTLSTRRVCWHRNTSISMREYIASIQNNISGELFRRYKNSNKWQRLWVVFTNFCLFFFRSHEDEAPLTSLPLIGYSVSKPSEAECHDDFVFKLQYKTHVYFFRAENEYAYERWMEVITSATRSAPRSRIFSRHPSNTTDL